MSRAKALETCSFLERAGKGRDVAQKPGGRRKREARDGGKLPGSTVYLERLPRKHRNGSLLRGRSKITSSRKLRRRRGDLEKLGNLLL